ncbi:SIMPL domain-containing protein [Hymenobacter arizonensis]|uniref:Uncharacterized conserved protein YggE, contains kinase-interacting SIMPL domain n=1 Tax=Hymenobacter arizonensis TaxID=1227077 RepID=A0A1I6AJI1_HYMAR|nr:SIMPL domain-containing protein [Hymenobacter arizonensis]SFQ68859.1 Uncharacterized conserved protein YggE, contains kinase-interacting SIMPL domain [Hymenobacter arizonensis]
MRYLLLLLPFAHPVAAQVAPPTPPRTILVRGTAEQELDPEKLDLLLTYRFSDNVKESGRTQEQEQNLQRVLTQAGIAPEKLLLEDLSASGYGGFSKTGNANVALTKVYRLTLNNPKLLNSLIPQLVQTGADNLRVVNLESSRLDAAQLEVAGRAAANARQKAQTVVKQAGGQLGGVVAATEVLPGSPGNNTLSEYQLGADKKVKSMGGGDGGADIATPNLRKIKVKAVYDMVFEVK